MTSGRVTHVFADGLSTDATSGFEDSSDDRSIAVRNKALDEVGSKKHRYIFDCDIVLDGELLATQLAAGVGFLVDNITFPGPGAVGVFTLLREVDVLARET